MMGYSKPGEIHMKDKISIILPIFNVGPHLRGGIDSLINQTIGNENLEIIMVDDCSTDESGKIIDEYDEKYDCCKGYPPGKNILVQLTVPITEVLKNAAITLCF